MLTGSRIPGPKACQLSCWECQCGCPELGGEPSREEGRSPISKLTPSPLLRLSRLLCTVPGRGSGEPLATRAFATQSFIFPLVHRLSLVHHSCSYLVVSFGLQIDFHFELMSMFWTYTWENKGVWKRQNNAQCYFNFSQEEDSIYFSDGLPAQQLLWRNNYLKFALSN